MAAVSIIRYCLCVVRNKTRLNNEIIYIIIISFVGTSSCHFLHLNGLDTMCVDQKRFWPDLNN